MEQPDPEPPARVIVCVRTRVYREGLVDGLQSLGDFRVAASTGSAYECIDLAVAAEAALVLLDVGAPAAETALNVLRREAPATRIVAFAMPDVEAEVMAWVKKGAAGFVTTEDSLADLIATLRSVARGEGRCSPRMIGALLRSVHVLASERPHTETGPPPEPLTARELEIGVLLERGLTNRQIGAELCIELPTVKNHIHRIYTKLSVGGRSQAGARLRALGLAPVPGPVPEMGQRGIR